MRTVRRYLAAPLALLVSLSSTALAQERHLVDPAALAQTVTQHAARQDADRATIRETLDRPEVQAVASRLGIDRDRLLVSVDTLSGADLARAADAARDADRSLVGGASTIVISTTAIIIILLIVLIIVAAD
jgi:hypothetical protein